MLGHWGIENSHITLQNGLIHFSLSWPQAPYALNLGNLSGNLSLKLEKGRIIQGQTSDAAMGIGRMLSIFSLQTIPRRLTLDFSDLFQKGYSFDNLKGDFTLNAGNAMTNNTVFEGPAARVNVSGRIGLTAQDFNMLLKITPYVTSSIPVAAALLTGQPVVGIAAFVVNKMITSPKLSSVATYSYKVTGSWANPVWTQN